MHRSYQRDRRRRLSAVLRAVLVLAVASVGAADAAHVTAPRHHQPVVTHTAPLASGAPERQPAGSPPRPTAHPVVPPPALTRPAQHVKLVSAPVTHPNDDFLGSTITAHEGKQSPPVLPPRPGATMPGLDVSHHQGTVNWRAVAAEGATFAYLKATEGTTFVDGQFSRNAAGSRAAGLFRGAYHFALPDRSSGAAQADFFVNHGGGWSADG
ncbi:MAG TPA: GH25 family lysozyme, partial [Pseudonocardiaceae bacterium]|nr:GH25 family lysozyme [Pseudonocardiaceae bacterium]